jgi:hypothetical protein
VLASDAGCGQDGWVPGLPSKQREARLERDSSVAPQMTSVKMRIARKTLCALCTAIPIQALLYLFVG